MSWSYSRALVAEFSDQCLTDIERSALSSTTPTPDQYYWPDKTTEHSRLSRFGMTCVPLMESHGEGLLTWYLAGFLVKTYPSLDLVQESRENDQGYGQKWRESLGKYDPVTRSLKTAQLCLLGESTPSSPTFTRWGSMLNGGLFPQPIAEPITNANESGFWPTPAASEGSGGGSAKSAIKALNREPRKSGAHRTLALRDLVKLFPTPTVSGNYNRKGASKTSGDGLATVIGEQLNPPWVEWLMGWPIGLTDLKPLETDKFQSWLQQHGIF